MCWGVMYLNVVTASQQRSSLPVLADNITALEWIHAKDAGDGNRGGDNEEEGHDSESLDPLYGNNDG